MIATQRHPSRPKGLLGTNRYDRKHPHHRDGHKAHCLLAGKSASADMFRHQLRDIRANGYEFYSNAQARP